MFVLDESCCRGRNASPDACLLIGIYFLPSNHISTIFLLLKQIYHKFHDPPEPKSLNPDTVKSF